LASDFWGLKAFIFSYYHNWVLLTEHADSELTLLTYIMEVLDSNLGRDTRYYVKITLRLAVYR
jgi:hypothetical protein